MPDQPTRILIVDDDFATRLLASEALLADGFETLEAEDGKEAIERYDRSSPQVILLDVNMPGLDGYEVCRRVRMRPGGESTAVMVMTANDDIDAVQRAFAAGATDFLTKPLNLPLLAHRVRFMLRAAATAAAARESASRLARAQRVARLVHWQLGSDERLRWSSDPFAVFWPDAPDDLRAGFAEDVPNPPNTEQLLAFIHPDDRERVGSVLSARAPHQLDFRLQFPDGSGRVVRQDAELDFGDHGLVLIGVIQDITEMKHAEQQIVQLAFYDDVTGIPNGVFVERYLRRADREPARTAIAIDLGIDHLDRLTVAARDLLIRAATACVIERVRGADLEIRLDQAARPVEELTGPTLVARIGPAELMIVTTDLTGAAAVIAAGQIADALTGPFSIAGAELLLRPRVGIADYPDPVADFYRLGDHAHEAMQDAERTPPRNVVVLTAEARHQRARRAELAVQLSAALDVAALAPHIDLCVDYVPRVEPGSSRVLGVRAQPRWLPGDGDPQVVAAMLADDPILRDRLARWTLLQTCRDTAQWLAAGTAVRVAVEIPYTQLLEPSFAELHHLVTHPSFEPILFDLELIDLPPTDDLDRVAAALRSLRELGVRIALACVDDSRSLGELRRLPLDAVRVDGAMIERLGPGFVAALARGFDLRIAATAVDSSAALAALAGCEPDELSGAWLAAAVSATDVLGFTPELASEPPRRPIKETGGTLLSIDP